MCASHLQAADDLLEGQSALCAPDEGGGGQAEYLVQVRLIQTVEAYKFQHAPGRANQGEEGREDREDEGMMDGWMADVEDSTAKEQRHRARKQKQGRLEGTHARVHTHTR